MSSYQLEIVNASTGKLITTLKDLDADCSILDVKGAYKISYPNLYVERQSFKLEQRGKALKDSDTLKELGVKSGGKLFFKDLGPQIGWSTVFLAEYAGPLFIYLLFYMRPEIVYGEGAAAKPKALVVDYAAACWSFHYAKRLLETMFVHRFSHATMPIRNLFKNCSYYWGFTAFVAYFINHPLYTPAMFGDIQIYSSLALFAVCEFGNFSIHIALRNLRPAGSTERRIPKPTSNPLTYLFGAVSCPNYTYEAGAWLSFAAMTQCLPALMFAVAGFYQMAIWALGKHRNYKKEFKDYPRFRRAIMPFIL